MTQETRTATVLMTHRIVEYHHDRRTLRGRPGKEVVAGTERIGVLASNASEGSGRDQRERPGVVADVRGGRAYVDPDFDHVDDDLSEQLGWREGDEYTILESAITEIANAEVRLREDL